MRRIYKLVADVLGIDENSVSSETSIETVENWDSFNMLLLASEIDRLFAIKLSMEEIAEMKSINAIKDILKKKKVELNHV